MRVWFRRLHLGFAWLFVVAILYQVYLAGRAIFVRGQSWEDHVVFGFFLLPLVALLVLLSAIAAGMPRLAIGLAALPLLGVFVQYVLATFKYAGQPEVAALHPVTALVVFGIGVVVARQARGFLAEAKLTAAGTPRDLP